MLGQLKELYAYRELVRYLVATDLKVRYRGSVLGILWTLLNPLMLTLVMWLVFSRFGRLDEKNYALFLLASLMVWVFFSQSIGSSLTSILKHRGLIDKIYLPKLVFPVALVTSNLVNLGFFLLAYLLIALCTDVGVPPTAILIIPAVIMLYMLSVGGALLMSALNVFYRDFTHLTEVLLRALFYLTPVFYPPTILGDDLSFVLKFNPVYYPVVLARDVLYYGTAANPIDWLIGFAVAFGMFVLGLKVFTSSQDNFVYYA